MDDNNKKSVFSVMKNSIIFRIVLIGITILIMLIPFSMILSLINERESRRKSVIREINSKWAFSQTIIGPVVDVPVKNVKFNKAMISLGISDMRGIYKTIELQWNNKNLTPDPGVRNTDIFSQGVNSNIQIDGNLDKYSFFLYS